jgi:hypothetical protein
VGVVIVVVLIAIVVVVIEVVVAVVAAVVVVVVVEVVDASLRHLYSLPHPWTSLRVRFSGPTSLPFQVKIT